MIYRRSTSSSCSCGWRRARPLPWPGDVRLARARRRGADLRRGPGRGLPAHRRADPRLHEPSGAGVRVDSGIAEGGGRGQRLRPDARQGDRARRRPGRGAAPAATPRCGDTVLLGLDTNIGFLRALLADPDVRAGRLDTGLVGRRSTSWTAADAARRRARRPRPRTPCSSWSPAGAGGGPVRRARRLAGRRAGLDDAGGCPWPGTTRSTCASAAGRARAPRSAIGRRADPAASVAQPRWRARPTGADAPAASGAGSSVTVDGVTRAYACARRRRHALARAATAQAWGIREQAPARRRWPPRPGRGRAGALADARHGHRRRGRRGPDRDGGRPARRRRGHEDGARAHRAGRRRGARPARHARARPSPRTPCC